MPDVLGDLVGEFEIRSMPQGRNGERRCQLEFVLNRRQEVPRNWQITAEMSGAELLQLRDAIDAEIRRAFAAA